MTPRILITGIGVVAPGGATTKEFWDLLTSGRTATRRISTFDPSPFRSQVAAECDIDPTAAGFSQREIRRMDRATILGVMAARQAMQDSELNFQHLDPARIGVSVGSAVGATTSRNASTSCCRDTGREWKVDPAYASPHLYDYLTPGTIAAEVAWTVGAEGPTAVVSSGCTSGLDSVGYAFQLLQEGAVDVVIAGGTDAPISPIAVACFDAIKATTPNNSDPATASRPFDRTRSGFVLAEGSAMLVLEREDHAARRGASAYAEITGYATRCNAYHMTGLKVDGTEMAEAIRAATNQSRIDPTAIDYINAHGSGTKQNDRHETAAFKTALGQHAYRTPISSIKSMVGHSLGAIGSIEIAACALTVQNGVVPPTANLHDSDPECDLDYVPNQAREIQVDTVLTVGSGFGGFQSAMMLRRPGLSR